VEEKELECKAEAALNLKKKDEEIAKLKNEVKKLNALRIAEKNGYN
jgi:hypothetical protein